MQTDFVFDLPRETAERMLALLNFIHYEAQAVNASKDSMRLALMSKNLALALLEIYGKGALFDDDIKALRIALGKQEKQTS